MKYQLINGEDINLNDPDDNGLFRGSWGGTERMYEGLIQRLSPELANKVNIICSRVRQVAPDKPNVLWLHDTFNDPESSHLREPQSRQRFAQLVFVSNYQFNTYNLGLGVPYHNSMVLRNAIVPIEDHQKPDPKDGLRLVYHTTPHRGLELLVPAFVELVKYYPNMHLDVFSSFSIYGWKERDAAFEKLFDTCRQHPNITYHGAVPNAQIRDALKQAHIFAYPSIWPETSCIAAMEALSAGCAIVAPDYAALPETLSTYGFLYRFSEDINVHFHRFAQTLQIVMNNFEGNYVQQNIHYGKVYADNEYNWDRRINEWSTLLEALTKN